MLITALAAEMVLNMRKNETFLETIFLPASVIDPSGDKVMWVPNVNEQDLPVSGQDCRYKCSVGI